MAWLAFLMAVVSGFAVADGNYPACPDLSGRWSCRLYVNGGEEPVYETIVVTQTAAPDGAVAYDFGGARFTARWDRETAVLENRKARCLGETAVLLWYEDEGDPHHQTITRTSPTTLRNDQLRLRPRPLWNNVVSRRCKLVK